AAGPAGAVPAAPAAPGTPAARPTAAEAANQDRAAQILSQAEAAANGVRSLEADFTQTMTVPLLNQTQRSTGKLFQRKPDRFLMRFSDPAGDLIVADGRHFWLYYPSADRTQVIRTSIAEGGEAVDLQAQFLSNPNQRFVSTVAGEESVGGRPAHVLTLVPRGASPYRILKVWVDKEDHLVRRFEITEENESVRRVELRNLRTNHALANSLFTFTPPEGAQVFDQ
ncbi:MAG TPA: outer membrane lipoprotein chaperone LolA, partial [Longimicrobium sp.]|nr:outer membrane lipoprotein chaperone LolA [Longimicrobium sp.]